MTKIQRREIYWKMYCAAVGLAQMGRQNVWNAFLEGDFYTDELPPGFCRMYQIIKGDRWTTAKLHLPELELPEDLEKFKYPKGNWEVRLKPLEKAIQLTYE